MLDEKKAYRLAEIELNMKEFKEKSGLTHIIFIEIIDNFSRYFEVEQAGFLIKQSIAKSEKS